MCHVQGQCQGHTGVALALALHMAHPCANAGAVHKARLSASITNRSFEKAFM
jgi:hypothetical protein